VLTGAEVAGFSIFIATYRQIAGTEYMSRHLVPTWPEFAGAYRDTVVYTPYPVQIKVNFISLKSAVQTEQTLVPGCFPTSTYDSDGA